MTAEEFKKSLDELYPQKGAHERAYDTLMRYEIRYELEDAFEQGRLAGREEQREHIRSILETVESDYHAAGDDVQAFYMRVAMEAIEEHQP